MNRVTEDDGGVFRLKCLVAHKIASHLSEHTAFQCVWLSMGKTRPLCTNSMTDCAACLRFVRVISCGRHETRNSEIVCVCVIRV